MDVLVADEDSAVVHADDSNYAKEVQLVDGAVLVYFSAEWCQPCKMLGPVMEELATEYRGKVKIVKVDVDESYTVAFTEGVQSVPTLILYQDGVLLNIDTRPSGRMSVMQFLLPVL